MLSIVGVSASGHRTSRPWAQNRPRRRTEKAHRATAVALVALFDRESIQESDNHNSSQPLVLKSHQRVRRATGVAPCDKESIQESESKPLGLNLHQKACTATGAAPFDKESIQESENRLYASSIQA